MKTLFALALAGALGLVGLSTLVGDTRAHSDGTPETGEMTMVTIPPLLWEVRQITTGDGTIPAPDGRPMMLQFLPDGQLAVTADCNRGRGSWSIEGEAVTISAIGTTRMFCGEGSPDTAFLTAIDGTLGWSIERETSDVLTLTGANGSVVLDPVLTGLTWQWENFQGGDGSVVTPTDPTLYTVTFQDNGMVMTTSACNNGAGQWGGARPQIDITLGVTRKACMDENQEDEFYRNLDEATSYVIVDGHLALSLPVDAGIMFFTPVIETAPAGSPEATPMG